MINKLRNKKRDEFSTQLKFCLKLLIKLDIDFERDCKAQDEDPWDSFESIKNYSRYENDIIRIRRELNDLRRLL